MFVNDNTNVNLIWAKGHAQWHYHLSLKDTILNSCESNTIFPLPNEHPVCSVSGNISYLRLWINIFPLPNEHPVCCDREHQLSPSVNQRIPLTQWASSLLCQGTSAISVCESTTIFPLPNKHPVCCVREHQLSPLDIQSAWLRTPQP